MHPLHKIYPKIAKHLNWTWHMADPKNKGNWSPAMALSMSKGFINSCNNSKSSINLLNSSSSSISFWTLTVTSVYWWQMVFVKSVVIAHEQRREETMRCQHIQTDSNWSGRCRGGWKWWWGGRLLVKQMWRMTMVTGTAVRYGSTVLVPYLGNNRKLFLLLS